MKTVIAPETIEVTFKPYDEADLTPDRLYQLQYFLDEGYQSEDYGKYTRVFRKPYIEVLVDGVEIVNATHKILPWYGSSKNATEEIATQVAKDIEEGVLEVFYDGDDVQNADFARHSLHKEEVAV